MSTTVSSATPTNLHSAYPAPTVTTMLRWLTLCLTDVIIHTWFTHTGITYSGAAIEHRHIVPLSVTLLHWVQCDADLLRRWVDHATHTQHTRHSCIRQIHWVVDTDPARCYTTHMKIITLCLTLIILTQCSSNPLGYNYADQFLKTHGAQYRIIGDRVYTTR